MELSSAPGFNQRKHWILHMLMFGSKSRTTCYQFSFASPDENCSTPAILRETSYRHMNDLHVSTAPCLHENVIFRVLTHMLLLRTLSRSRSLHPNHSRDHCRLHVHIPKHSRVRRLNPFSQPNTEQFQGVSIPSDRIIASSHHRHDASAPSVLHRA